MPAKDQLEQADQVVPVVAAAAVEAEMKSEAAVAEMVAAAAVASLVVSRGEHFKMERGAVTRRDAK